MLDQPSKESSQLIELTHEARDPAPPDVWDFREITTWRSDIWEVIGNFVLVEDVRIAFLRSPPEYVVSDDLSWLDSIIYSTNGENVDSKFLMTQGLRSRYKFLRAVHGTRTADVEVFYRDGLVPLVPENYHNQARELFLSGQYPELSEKSLQSAIATVGTDLREQRIFFEANEEMLIKQAGHYMLYGSEYLTAIAAHLGNCCDYRQVLKKRGRPTLFVCDVPLDFISEYTLQEFAGAALQIVFQELLDGPVFQRDRWRGAGFCIRKPLPAANILGHYHPEIHNDPLCG